MNWPWHRKRHDWQIQPQDIHWLGFETSFVIREGWEPFGVSSVPNALDQNQIRVWTRRQSDKGKQYEIKMQSAGWGGHQVILHLSAGWEPFAVSISAPDQPIIWFRRKVDAAL